MRTIRVVTKDEAMDIYNSMIKKYPYASVSEVIVTEKLLIEYGEEYNE
jgi:hypothetical protein